jgi:hypothetical protein
MLATTLRQVIISGGVNINIKILLNNASSSLGYKTKAEGALESLSAGNVLSGHPQLEILLG